VGKKTYERHLGYFIMLFPSVANKKVVCLTPLNVVIFFQVFSAFNVDTPRGKCWQLQLPSGETQFFLQGEIVGDCEILPHRLRKLLRLEKSNVIVMKVVNK
jgi:hypothetical protein